jgi:hypothetical protein
MFTDRFHGGPLDGETRGATATTMATTRVTDEHTGAVYVRDLQRDTEDTRSWTHQEVDPHTPQAVLYQAKDGLTIGELRAFVATADTQGWPDDYRLRAVASWRLRLTELELSRRGRPRPGPTG